MNTATNKPSVEQYSKPTPTYLGEFAANKVPFKSRDGRLYIRDSKGTIYRFPLRSKP